MSKIQDAFDAMGRQLFESEKEAVAVFNEKYKSSLQIIQESRTADSKVVFHDHSRTPFDYEQPVIDAVKAALDGKTFKRPQVAPKQPMVNLPAWLYKDAQKPVTRVYEVEKLIYRLNYVACELKVELPKEMFDKLVSDEMLQQMYTYTWSGNTVALEDLAEGRRWIKISKTLFVEEQ